jgi:hypothetical protein
MTDALHRFASRECSFARIGGAYAFAGALAMSLLAAAAWSVPAGAGEGIIYSPLPVDTPKSPPPADTPKAAAPCPSAAAAKKILRLKIKIDKNKERASSLQDKMNTSEKEIQTLPVYNVRSAHLQRDYDLNLTSTLELLSENRRLQRELDDLEEGC